MKHGLPRDCIRAEYRDKSFIAGECVPTAKRWLKRQGTLFRHAFTPMGSFNPLGTGFQAFDARLTIEQDNQLHQVFVQEIRGPRAIRCHSAEVRKMALSVRLSRHSQQPRGSHRPNCGYLSPDATHTKTLFPIASNSKLFTIVALGMLIENGTSLPDGQLLTWDTKVKSILPEWELVDPYASAHVDLVDLASESNYLVEAHFRYAERPCTPSLGNAG